MFSPWVLVPGELMKKIISWILLISLPLVADPVWIRWTGADDPNPDLLHVLRKIQIKTGLEFSLSDFIMLESRRLAHSHFTMLAQAKASVPVRHRNIRLWTSVKTGELIQAEALVEKLVLPPHFDSIIRYDAREILQRATALVRAHQDDPFIRDIKLEDFWDPTGRIRVITIKGKRGKHFVTMSLETGRIVESRYEEFPQGDAHFSVPVQVYPIYEEIKSSRAMLTRIPSELRYLNRQIHRTSDDVYAPLKTQRYDFEFYDPLLGLTVEGRKQGYWAMGYIKGLAAELVASTPLLENAFDNGGVVLDGRFTSINIYPEAALKFKHLNFTPATSYAFVPLFQEMPDKPGHEEMIPSGSFLGRPIASLDEAWKRLARRLPDHDPESYLNDGFDEIQVYWAVTRLFESLTPMGFTDPELSTRPFHAFLYNPDISYRDNAFYTDDTINFTTYSSQSTNMARDNTTIWHELGHGVMDRLMGDHIRLADTGGLSEGMADFIASILVSDVTGGLPFEGKSEMRIINQIGFHLTNEVHDDGEAYGGAMNDLLESAVARYGRDGLHKVTDLTLEAMRLSRNHPGLTANDWFERMLFADDLGRSGLRDRGELRSLITASVNGRNFASSGTPARFDVMNGEEPLTATGPGSRPRPIPINLKETESVNYELKLSLHSGTDFRFKFPVTIRAEFLNSPLQGAIHWTAEEENPVIFTLLSESNEIKVPLTVLGKCDAINRPDGSCVDYVHLQVFNRGESKPVAKKRFYLRVIPNP